MLKKIASSVIVLLFVSMILCACGSGGKTDDVELYIGNSNIYSTREIEHAMDVVIHFFKKEYRGCTLLTLSYDEALSLETNDRWAAQYNVDEAIVLTSSFNVDSTGGSGNLNPNTTYDNWKWILTRSNHEGWTLKNCGY